MPCISEQSLIDALGPLLQVNSMMDERMREIETRIRDTPNLAESEREKLLGLLATVREEVNQLATSHTDDAQSITHFLAASTHEASRAKKRPKLLQAAQNGLMASVENFESSHPKLFEAAVVLANMGL
ncbi:MAG TPA: hypothetical protein VGK72_10935 [Chthoniobacterales bacterium]|jgi:hypothetical protein